MSADQRGRSLRRLGLVCLLAAFVRFALFSAGFYESFNSSYEIVTPISSFKRLKEGLWLIGQGMSPYSGSAFHHIPLALALFYPFKDSSAWVHHSIFIGFDLFSGFLIWLAVASYRRPRHDDNEGLVLKAIEGQEIPPKPSTAKNSFFWPSPHYLPELAALIFLLNPLTIASCVAQSLQTIENALVIATVCAAVCGKFFLSAMLLGLIINFSPYFITLALPLALLIQECKFIQQKDQKSQLASSIAITSGAFSISKSVTFVIATTTFTGCLVYASFLITGGKSWEFVWKSYGFLYNAEELTPNIGLFWYFFT
eukprot:TRINITY_DN3995_c0_g1_i1.p1 TRINITY_DN3995_c0_g1~~TRINITY_DN3995_c0_g1_i1.p1  ORF type:complete len:319 (-),score=37.80 TRINITY_DN3995_c0_g1_i1:506-1441(-)